MLTLVVTAKHAFDGTVGRVVEFFAAVTYPHYTPGRAGSVATETTGAIG